MDFTPRDHRVHGSDDDLAPTPRLATFDIADLLIGATTGLFEGGPRAGVGVTMFILRTPPGAFVELHTHPYVETFVLLEGRARWTAGDEIHELVATSVITVPPHTLHGFRNVGDVPLRMVTVHESPTLIQDFTDDEPA